MSDRLFSPKKAEKLLREERRKTVPVDKVVSLLELNGNEKVIDLGAGNGYLTLPIANSTKERVTAVDVQMEMLDMLASRAEGEGLQNIERLESRVERLNLPDGSFERAVAAFVLHEVTDLQETLREIRRVLNENGLLLILDWEKVESEEGPPLDHRISSEEMKQAVEGQGFTVETGRLNQAVYYLIAREN
ncbi:methyltransferase domain-containing protein [Halobacillus salinarum]|uniref:Methyltransferase domain-containing protein n=1 Tax=Halobacillus salinarum TaxID=2932257 RepID=A0ABY4EGS7_9BACI|nr:methyltransferase domain-containing protein [Halobacillus salinarum]UOQ43257.1 methyltransferase domain-containing protein [Halobacillus salinarum]